MVSGVHERGPVDKLAPYSHFAAAPLPVRRQKQRNAELPDKVLELLGREARLGLPVLEPQHGLLERAGAVRVVHKEAVQRARAELEAQQAAAMENHKPSASVGMGEGEGATATREAASDSEDEPLFAPPTTASKCPKAAADSALLASGSSSSLLRVPKRVKLRGGGRVAPGGRHGPCPVAVRRRLCVWLFSYYLNSL